MRHIMETSILWKNIMVNHGRRGAIIKDKGERRIMNVVQRGVIVIIGKRGVIKVIREMDTSRTGEETMALKIQQGGKTDET